MKVVALTLATLTLGGCVTVKHQLTDPNVAARFDSSKSAEEFARCAAAGLPSFELKQLGSAWALIEKRDIRLVSRWDFFPSNAGSQAELRNGAKDDGGVQVVRACA